MAVTEKDVYEYLKMWKLTLKDISKLEDDIKAMQYRITPTYSLAGRSGGGLVNSKVEKYCLKIIEKEMELKGAIRQIKIYEKAIRECKLTIKEKGVIKYLQNGYTLSSFARDERIYLTSVYKIKDRAISKIARKINVLML